MGTRKKRNQFRLMEIAAFDARSGYKRCKWPGVGAGYEGGPRAAADFWYDKSGKMVVRCSCQGYAFHCEGILSSGKAIPPSELDNFGEYVIQALLEWLNWGVDDTPPAFDE